MAKQPKAWPHKVRPVRIADMRVAPIGVVQRRFSQSQAEEYAAAMDFNKIGVPAVNVRDAVYWIVDGQHRIAALKHFFAPHDPGAIECSVYEDLTDAEMAELFIGLNTRRAVHRFDLFKSSCTAERKLESEIQRVVEAIGLKITRTQGQSSISAVSALCQVANRSGMTVLGQALRVLRDGLPGDEKAFDSQLILGAANVFQRFNGRTNERQFAKALSDSKGAVSILKRAEAQRDRTGNLKGHCVAAAMVDLYNKGLNSRDSHRLPSWWKEAENAARG